MDNHKKFHHYCSTTGTILCMYVYLKLFTMFICCECFIKTLWPSSISKAQLRKRQMTTRMVDDSAGLVSDSGAVEGALASGLSHVDNPRHRRHVIYGHVNGKIWENRVTNRMDLDLDGMGYQIFRPFSDHIGISSHWLNRSFNSLILATHLLSSGDVLLFQINLARSGNIESLNSWPKKKKSDHLRVLQGPKIVIY